MKLNSIFNKIYKHKPQVFQKIGALKPKIMLENFLKFTEVEKLTKAQQKTIQGGDIPEDEGRKGKVAA